MVDDINRAAAETALDETLRPGRHRPPSPTSLRSLTGGVASALMRQCRNRFGAVEGVIHNAGVVHSGSKV